MSLLRQIGYLSVICLLDFRCTATEVSYGSLNFQLRQQKDDRNSNLKSTTPL